MFVLANVLIGLAQVLQMVLFLYRWILVGRAITSWVSADPRNPIVRFLYLATEPLLALIRPRLPMSLRYFPLDMAFLVLFGLVIFAEFAVVQTLIDAALRLKQ